jgi:hypothetical protein
MPKGYVWALIKYAAVQRQGSAICKFPLNDCQYVHNLVIHIDTTYICENFKILR